MPTRTRKVRGSRTQALVAEYYQRLWPAATTQGGGTAGRDVLNVPLSIEVKGRRVFDPLAWVRQARRAERPGEDEFPAHVVMRPDGLGEASVGDWLVIRRLADDTGLLEELIRLRIEVSRWRTGLPEFVVPDPVEMQRRRRELLEYTERNGGWMSSAAHAELEELRGRND
jgi:hypothetical protein